MYLANKVKWLSLAVLLLPSTAGAFEKQQLPAASKPGPAVIKSDPRSELAPAETGPQTRSTGGTTISIPGLGQLGVIPKLDFGMELLYGSEPKSDPAPLAKDEDDGLQIRGTIKHRF